METLQFKVEINAPATKVWNVLWDDETYRKWTLAFCDGSYAVSNWNEGDTIHFLAPNGDGMYSKIHKKIDHKFMSFNHIGNIKNYEEMPVDEETKDWCNSFESYELTEENGKTTVLVSIDALEAYISFFNTTMPRAMGIVKDLSEN